MRSGQKSKNAFTRGRNLVMKKMVTLVSGILLVGFLLSTAIAGGQNNSKGTQHSHQKGQTVDRTEAIEVESNVSQARVDTVIDQENRSADVKKKLKIRAKNVKSSPKTNDELFQHSK